MKKIAIFTPTYNRGKELKNVYQSLILQEKKDFTWYIVDDGSTDETEKIITEMQKEKKIDIKYFNKKNGGKHSAFNYYLDCVDNEYSIISLDSDDIMTEDALNHVIEKIEEIDKKYAGIVFLKEVSNINNQKYNSLELQGLSLKEAINSNMYNAECIFVFRNDYLKQFRFPIIKNENFFTEAYIYCQMDEPMLWTDIIIERGTYLLDGLTNNTAKSFIKAPNSWMLYNEIRMKNNKNFLKRIKYTIYFISFCILSKNKHKLKEHNLLLMILLYPIGLIGALYLKKRGGR